MAVIGLFLLAQTSAHGQSTLSAGDIAFTGIDATANSLNGPESNKDFCFVLLRPISANTVIYFTDYGWRSDAPAFQTAVPCGAGTGAVTDGVVKWQSATALPYGTQIRIRSQATPSANTGTATGFQATYNSPTQYVTVAAGGESLFAYQGSIGSPTLIAGINMYPTGWATTLNNCDFNPTASLLPAALNSNNYAFTLTPSSVNMRLKASVNISGNAAQARLDIANKTNWEFSATAYVLPSANVVMPVNLVSFTASALEKNEVKLAWRTATEQNNKSFTIDRYGDNQAMQQLSVIAGAGSSAETTDYSFVDNHPLAGNNYYRLTQTDIDGKRTILGTRRVYAAVNQAAVTLFPNPAGKVARINLAAGNFTKLVISDATGNALDVHTFPSSLTTLQIDISKYSTGTYFVQLTGPGKQETIKFQKIPGS